MFGTTPRWRASSRRSKPSAPRASWAAVTPNEVSGKIRKDTGANPTLGRLNCFEALADPPKMPYVPLIEFRPNDLALPRIARLTDDILPKSRMSRLR